MPDPSGMPDLKSARIERSLQHPYAQCYFYYMRDERKGGVIVISDPRTKSNIIDFIYVPTEMQNRQFAQLMWESLINLFPKNKIKVWQAMVPYRDKKSINLFVNKLHYQIVEMFNEESSDDNETFLLLRRDMSHPITMPHKGYNYETKSEKPQS